MFHVPVVGRNRATPVAKVTLGCWQARSNYKSLLWLQPHPHDIRVVVIVIVTVTVVEVVIIIIVIIIIIMMTPHLDTSGSPG